GKLRAVWQLRGGSTRCCCGAHAVLAAAGSSTGCWQLREALRAVLAAAELRVVLAGAGSSAWCWQLAGKLPRGWQISGAALNEEPRSGLPGREAEEEVKESVERLIRV
ncbi:hypothetical protein CYMTET_35034, partial [Cymbomonas tetramitiformis]